MNRSRSIYKTVTRSMQAAKDAKNAARTTVIKGQKFQRATGERETVEQFLARGGTVTICPARYVSAGFAQWVSVRAWV